MVKLKEKKEKKTANKRIETVIFYFGLAILIAIVIYRIILQYTHHLPHMN